VDLDIVSDELSVVVSEWPNVENSDRVRITRWGDEVHIAILEGGVSGPFPGAPLYLAPQRQDIRIRPQDAKFDRSFVKPHVEGEMRSEMLRLHMQHCGAGSNLLIGWRAHESLRPRKTFQGLLNRVMGVYDVYDHLPELSQRDSLEVMIRHDQMGWRHWLLCKNEDQIGFLPTMAEQFLRSIFGDRAASLTEAFLYPERLEHGCRVALPPELSCCLDGYREAILAAEAKLAQLQDVITGKTARRMRLPGS